jgi:hypothetical protein
MDELMGRQAITKCATLSHAARKAMLRARSVVMIKSQSETCTGLIRFAAEWKSVMWQEQGGF